MRNVILNCSNLPYDSKVELYDKLKALNIIGVGNFVADEYDLYPEDFEVQSLIDIIPDGCRYSVLPNSHS